MSSAPRQMSVSCFQALLAVLIVLPGDETRPVCKACGKKNRPCQWEEPHTKFKDYRPDGPSSSRSAAGGTDEETETKEDMMDVDGADGVDNISRTEGAVRANSFSEEGLSRNTSPRRRKTVGPMGHRKAHRPASHHRRLSYRQARLTLFPDLRVQRVACRWRVCCSRTTRTACQRARCRCIPARPCSSRMRIRITVETCQMELETTHPGLFL